MYSQFPASVAAFWRNVNGKTLDELFPGNIHKNVISTKSNAPLRQVVSDLRSLQFLSLPVVDEGEGQMLGMVDCLDLVCLLADVKSVDKVLEMDALSAMNYSKKDEFAPMYIAGPFSALLNVLSSGVHRCPVVEASGRFIGIISQLDVLSWMEDYCEDVDQKLGVLGKKTLQELGMVAGRGNVKVLDHGVTLLECLEAVKRWGVSAVPLVDGEEVVGTFSVSDVRKIQTQKDLETPIKVFLNTPLAWPVTADPTTTFATIIKKLNAELLHRIWIVDEKNSPVGVVSLTDVIAQLEQIYKEV